MDFPSTHAHVIDWIILRKDNKATSSYFVAFYRRNLVMIANVNNKTKTNLLIGVFEIAGISL